MTVKHLGRKGSHRGTGGNRLGFTIKSGTDEPIRPTGNVLPCEPFFSDCLHDAVPRPFELCVFRRLEAHFYRIEGVADAELRDAREDARNKALVVLGKRALGGLALSDAFIASPSGVWIVYRAMSMSY